MPDRFGTPEGCGESREIRSDGSVHVTRWTPDFRRSVDIMPDGAIKNDHIGPNTGIGQERVPFSSPYDKWDPRIPDPNAIWRGNK